MKQITFFLMMLLVSIGLDAQTPTNLGTDSGTLGNYGTYIGQSAGKKTTTDGINNTFLGTSAGAFNTTGDENTYLGTLAGGFSQTGSRNLFLGARAGMGNQGSGNVFIGYSAGITYEAVSNKLYIANSNTYTDSPLVYGDFSQEYLGIAIDPATDIPGTGANYGLYVGKGILTKKVKVANPGSVDWADYVFEENYDLNSLEEVEQFVKTNKHLPNVPSAKEVNENGVDMVEMDATLLRQIEELWLHIIEMKKENKASKEEIAEMQEEIAELQEKNEALKEEIAELEK